MWWQSGTIGFHVVDVVQGKDSAPLIDTPIGKLLVSRKLIADTSAQPPGLLALPNLIERAKTAKLKAEDLQLTEGVLTGIHLRSGTVIVHAEGALTKTADPAPDRTADRERVASAVDRLVGALKNTQLNELGRKCLEDTLRRLPREDANEDADEVAPSLARRIVRNGWLRQFFPEDREAITAMEKIIADAETFKPVTRFAGDNLQLADVRDAFGRGGWTITTPTRSAYTVPHSEPLYYWAFGNAKPMVVVDLAVGADPTAVDGRPIGAKLYQNGSLLAEWKKDAGLRSDLRTAWRSQIPAKGVKGIDPNAVTDFLPPHIAVTALNGDITQLITEGGVLTPPKDGSPAETERFLSDAAKTLADPARLDLIGEYLLKYVYDSPDSRFPFLLGTKTCKGDIHQTAQQTTSTVAGGMMRGDCDDLSELYQVIAEHQGRLSYVISLPRHAAAAFTERKDDGNWHTFVLQTGPPLEFADTDLKRSLEKTYKSFDESQPFDANGLGLLLRFSGENTRGAWRLSWRIFREPDYARTMIDVQRDWQYQTYQRGISKMKKLIEAGDQDNANYRELSGLYGFTGQYAKAVEMHQEAIKRTPDPNEKLQLAPELVMHQFDAGQIEAARATALDILDRQLPELRKNAAEKDRIEATQAAIGIELVGALVHGKAWDLALRTLKDTQLERMTGSIDQVGQWLVSPRFNEKLWQSSPQLDQLRTQMAMFCGTGISLLDGSGVDRLKRSADLKAIANAIDNWLAHVAFHGIGSEDDEDDAINRYAMAGRYYSALLGNEVFAKLLDQIDPPTDKNFDHSKRGGGLAQMQSDLPWISISVPYWTGQLMELFERDHTTLDRALVQRLGKRCAEAKATCDKLTLLNPSFEEESHLSALITALVGHDANGVREHLRWVKREDDKRIRDNTAQWLGDTARFLDKAWFEEVLGMWRDEVDFKAKYFWIAWRAALNGAPEHALLAAALAKDRFKDDPSFAEEYEFMKQMLTPSKPAMVAPAAGK